MSREVSSPLGSGHTPPAARVSSSIVRIGQRTEPSCTCAGGAPSRKRQSAAMRLTMPAASTSSPVEDAASGLPSIMRAGAGETPQQK